MMADYDKELDKYRTKVGSGYSHMFLIPEAKLNDLLRRVAVDSQKELTYDMLSLPEWAVFDGRQAEIKQLRDALWERGLKALKGETHD